MFSNIVIILKGCVFLIKPIPTSYFSFSFFKEKVLIEAYKKCLSALMQCHSGFTDGEQPIVLSMCGHSVETIRYCVSQEKVSIHLPVSRLLAGKNQECVCVCAHV